VAKNKDKDREFRLRPPKPPARGECRVYASAYKIIMHHARMSGIRRLRAVGFGGGTTPARSYSQRCAVRVLYAKNTSRGQWRAHGRYIARESAGDRGVGFDGADESIDIAARLEGWQKASDGRLWKLIVSPEFGDRVDLTRLTRDLIAEMQTDLGMPLEWVAVAHCEVLERKDGRFGSAGISSARASGKSRKIIVRASSGFVQILMPPKRSVARSISTDIRRLTASSSAMPRPGVPNRHSSRLLRTQAGPE
jgi:hypothetical protein